MVVPTQPSIDTDRFSSALRSRGIDRECRKLLITNLRGSEQEQDLSEPPNCNGFGRIRHFRLVTGAGWPPNPLPIVPAARALGLAPASDVIRAQVFQNAICNWRCWYCFVDFPLLAANPKHSSWLGVDQLLDLYLDQSDPPPMIDLSGGQPDLVPEWVPWMMEALQRHGLVEQVYLWSDDNLSNDYFFTKLTPAERDLVNRYRLYGKVCCFKGFDERSFAFNTAAAPELFARQFEVMGRLLVETAIDLYCYVTLTTAESAGIEAGVRAFVDRLQLLDERLPLRMVPLEITVFTPVRARIRPEHERALSLQQQACAAWQAELESRFTAAERQMSIADVALRI